MLWQDYKSTRVIPLTVALTCNWVHNRHQSRNGVRQAILVLPGYVAPSKKADDGMIATEQRPLRC